MLIKPILCFEEVSFFLGGGGSEMRWYKEILNIDTPQGRAVEQAMVEGRIAPPATQPAVEKVLMLNARTVILSTEPMKDMVMMEGRVYFDVIYESEQSVYAFESSANFKHGIEMSGMETNAMVDCKAKISGIEHKMEAGVVSVKAAIGIECSATMRIEMEALSGGEDMGDMQMLYTPMETCWGVDNMNSSMIMKEEVMIAQGLPSCERMLSTNAHAMIGRVSAEDGKVIVEGDVHITTSYLCSDPTVPIQQREYTLPFAHMMMMKEAKESMMVNASAQVAEIYGSMTGQDEGESRAFSYEIVLSINAKLTQKSEMKLVSDAYSPSYKVESSKDKFEIEKCVNTKNMQTMYQGTVEYSKDEDKGYRVLSACAKPYMTNVVQDGANVMIEGVAAISMICMNREGQLESIETQMPYSLKDDSMGYMQDVDYGCDLNIMGTQCMFKGNDIEIKLSITYSLSVYSKEMMNVLSNVNMTEEPIEPRKGVTVYFAKKGERLWDIASTYSTTMDAIAKANQGLSEYDLETGCLSDDNKLILYRSGA